MTTAEQVRSELLAVSAAEQFTFAVMQFRDGSRLHFCHRVDERWVHATGPGAPNAGSGLAGELRAAIGTFRLNAKHLDIQFADGSRWDERVVGQQDGLVVRPYGISRSSQLRPHP